MKTISTRLLSSLFLITSLFYGQAAIGKDDHVMLSISDALASDVAIDKIRDEVKLFWGDQAHAKLSKVRGGLSAST